MGSSKYPQQLDDTSSIPVAVDLVTPVNAAAVNNLRDAIIAVETELGIQPSGVFGSVAAKLLDTDASINAISINPSTTESLVRFRNQIGAFKDSPNGPFVLDSGFVGIGTATPDKALAVVGGGSFTGDVTVGSGLFIGSAFATTGDLRVESGFQLVGLSNSGLSDLSLLATNSTDNLLLGDTDVTSVRILASLLEFGVAVPLPVIAQEENTTNAATGTALLIHAQDATGTGITTGGNIAIRPGSGTASGALELQGGDGTTQFLIDALGQVSVVNELEVNTAVGTVADAGDIRGPDSFLISASKGGSGSIVMIEKSDTDDVIIGSNTSAIQPPVIRLRSSTQINLTVGGFGVVIVTSGANGGLKVAENEMGFGSSSTNPILLQDDETSDGVSGELLTVHAQDSIGTGIKSGGAMLIRAGDATGGTDTGGAMSIRPGSGASLNGVLQLQEAGGGARLTISAIGDTTINATSILTLQRGGSERMSLSNTQGFFNFTNLLFRPAVVNPRFAQEDDTTNSITGDTLLIHAQDATGTTTIGGALHLRPGTGTTTNGSLILQDAAGAANVTLNGSSVDVALPLFLSGNGAHNVEVLAATKTLTLADPHYQKIDGGAASRNIDLPAEAASDGLWYQISNVGSTDNLVVRNDAAATIETLAPGQQAIFICDGTAWISLGNGSDLAAIHDNVAAEISAITEKLAPVTTDLLLIEDSAAANAKKKVQVGNLHPIVDTTALVKGSVDATKLVRIEADGITTATTRVLTMPDADITPDDASASRSPSGVAGGDLGGTYPNPTVDDGADATAIHDNISAEISVVTEKVTPVAADILLIEDSADSNNKKRIQVGNLPAPAAAIDYQAAFQAADLTLTSVFQDTDLSVTLGVGTWMIDVYSQFTVGTDGFIISDFTFTDGGVSSSVLKKIIAHFHSTTSPGAAVASTDAITLGSEFKSDVSAFQPGSSIEQLVINVTTSGTLTYRVKTDGVIFRKNSPLIARRKP